MKGIVFVAASVALLLAAAARPGLANVTQQEVRTS